MVMRGIYVGAGRVVWVDATDVLQRLERGERVSLLRQQVDALLSQRSPLSAERRAELNQMAAHGHPLLKVVDR